MDWNPLGNGNWRNVSSLKSEADFIELFANNMGNAMQKRQVSAKRVVCFNHVVVEYFCRIHMQFDFPKEGNR